MKLKDLNNAILIWGIVSAQGIEELKQQGALVVVPETRPYLIGLKYTCQLLKKDNIDFVYCNDNVLGFLFYKGKIKQTLLFYKELSQEGIVGPCGSLYVALLSKLHNIPIKIMPQGQCSVTFLDNDVSTLGGNLVVQEHNKDCIIRAGDEIVETEVLS